MANKEKVLNTLKLIKIVFPRATSRKDVGINDIEEIIFSEGQNHAAIYSHVLDEMTEEAAANYVCKCFINLIYNQ